MGLAEIRTQIKTLLETVPGIGKVHDFERWTTDWNAFLNYFKDSNNRINGWVITRSETGERLQSPEAVNVSTHTFVIKGYYGLKDSLESEKIFQDLIESVRSVLRVNSTLNGTCRRTYPPSVTILANRPYAGILMHQCEIQFKVEEYIRYTPV